METLYNYINSIPKQLLMDSHVHLFNEKVMDYPYREVDGRIIMVENSIRNTDRILLPCFDNFFSLNIGSKDSVLCIGCDREDTYNIYNKYSNKFSGFGEVKCYKHCVDVKGNELEYFDTDILESIFEMETNKPIFIHWDLNGKHDDEFEEFLKNFRSTKIVLCHCGINDLDDQYDSFKKACELQAKYTNLWLSISWVALDYFYKNMTQLSFIPIPDHTIVGTDFNPEMYNVGVDEKDRFKKFKTIYGQFDTPVALNNLFRLNKTLLNVKQNIKQLI